MLCHQCTRIGDVAVDAVTASAVTLAGYTVYNTCCRLMAAVAVSAVTLAAYAVAADTITAVPLFLALLIVDFSHSKHSVAVLAPNVAGRHRSSIRNRSERKEIQSSPL